VNMPFRDLVHDQIPFTVGRQRSRVLTSDRGGTRLKTVSKSTDREQVKRTSRNSIKTEAYIPNRLEPTISINLVTAPINRDLSQPVS